MYLWIWPYTLQNQKSGTLELLYNGEPKGIIHENIPRSEPLYVCARVCGHDGNCIMKIIDNVDEEPSTPWEEGCDMGF